MAKELYVDLKSALNDQTSVTIRIRDIERTIGDDWLIEFSAQANQLGARVDPHRSDASLVSVTRD